MALKFSVMSTNPSATRDVTVDLTGALETAETISGTPTVTASDVGVLGISATAVNTGAITVNGTTVAIGKAVVFRVTTVTASTWQDLQTINLRYDGTAGSSGDYTLEMPVAPKLVE